MKLCSLALVVAACKSPPAVVPPTVGFESPPIVDSHVHLALWPVDEQLAAAGVLYAVDLAAPDDALERSTALRQVLWSGPMLTHENGYPLDAWGKDGYGFGCATKTCIDDRLVALAAHHTRVVKLALDDDGLDPALVPYAIEAAHARDMNVAVHALSDAAANLAGKSNADVLAHTPVEPLSDDTIAAWAHHGAVITTLAAFGGSKDAVENLRKLRAAGVRVLYGTDLGNLRDAGPSAQEIALMRKAGMSDEAIADAMTTAPIELWHLDAPNGEDTKLVLDGDPKQNIDFLVKPREVWLRGKRIH